MGLQIIPLDFLEFISKNMDENNPAVNKYSGGGYRSARIPS